VIRHLAKALSAALILLLLLIALGAWQFSSALRQPLQVESERMLDVAQGATPGGLLNRLESEGVIDGAFWLRVYWRFKLSGETLHSGEYRMTPGMRASELLDLWRRGEVVQYSLTLVEGWNFRQLRTALEQQDKLQQTLAGVSDAELMIAVGAPGQFPEGMFFPDTYRYVTGMRDLDLLKQAHQRLVKVLEEEWEGRARNLPYKNSYQALIMASLVEKETGVPEERGQIAGVFVRRLALGMMLQTDPTVIYGLGERYNGRIGRVHLRDDNPYNTYRINGLPPTPIAMVGREAINAALHPVAGSSLYFVAKGDGSHVFSDTLDAHNRAVREYQLKRRSDYRSSPPPAKPAEKP
jgi:UPF0755 protein